MGKSKEVSRSNPCRMCLRPKQCLIGENGDALCYKVIAGGIELTDKTGVRYGLHKLEGAGSNGSPSASFEQVTPDIASADVLDRVYTFILAQLTVSKAHQAALAKRGFTPTAITSFGFKSCSARSSYEIAKACAERFPDDVWTKVPGLSLKDGKKGNYPSFGVSDGILIPVKNEFGQVVALRLRCDEETDTRYRWLSSKQHGGPGPGSPVGVWGWALGQSPAPTVRVCEGEFKAASSFEKTEIPALSAPGVAQMASPRAIELLQTMGAQTVLLAPDSDAMTNPRVTASVRNAIAALEKAGLVVVAETWDPAIKGIDDALAAGYAIEQIPTAEYLKRLSGEPEPVESADHPSCGRVEGIPVPVQNDWDVPLPLDRPQAKPVYPVHAIPEGIRPYVLALAEAYQIPASYAGSCVLAAASIATLKRCVVDTGAGDVTHLNAYFVTTLESGSGKSSCLGQVNAPVYEFERRFVEKLDTDGEPSDIGLISSDPTCEALEKLLRANFGRYAIANAEAGDLFAILTGRYSNGSASFGIYLKGYSGEIHRPDRVLRGATYIRNPRLAMNLALQPGSFDRFWALPEFIDRGFTARFLVDQPDSLLGYRKSCPAQIPRALKDEWIQTVSELLEVNPPKDEAGELEPHRIELKPDARVLLLRFKEQSELGLRPGGEWDSCREFGARAAEHVTKLAGLIHCLGFPKRPWELALTVSTMQMAIELFQYYATFAKQLLPSSSDLAKQKLLENILDKLRQKRDQWGESFKVRDLYQLTKRRSTLKTIEQLRNCLTELEELGYLREFVVAKGRPSPRYFVNPAVYLENGPQSPQPQANPYGTKVCDGDIQVPSGPQMSPDVPISSTDPPIGDPSGHDGPHLEANGGKGLNTIGDFGDLFQEIDI